MYRHRFDSVSFFFGLLFTAGAVSALLVDDPWPFGHGRFWPIVMIAGGLALLIAAFASGGGRRPDSAATQAAEPVPMDPVPMDPVPMDPTLMEAHREVSEYLGEATPDVEAAVPATVDAEPEPLPVDDPAELRPEQPTIPAVDDAEQARPEPGDPAPPTNTDG